MTYCILWTSWCHKVYTAMGRKLQFFDSPPIRRKHREAAFSLSAPNISNNSKTFLYASAVNYCIYFFTVTALKRLYYLIFSIFSINFVHGILFELIACPISVKNLNFFAGMRLFVCHHLPHFPITAPQLWRMLKPTDDLQRRQVTLLWKVSAV